MLIQLILNYKMKMGHTSANTAYTLRANALALWDIAPFGRNIVYAENDKQNAASLSPPSAEHFAY